MGMIGFFVPGKVVAKQAMRITRTGHRYTDKAVVSYENRVFLLGREAMGSEEPYDGPVAVRIAISHAMPKAWGRRKRADMMSKPVTGRPDLDNAAKIVCDGLKGSVVTDDALISVLHLEKRYADEDGVRVVVETIPSDWMTDFRGLRASQESAA